MLVSAWIYWSGRPRRHGAGRVRIVPVSGGVSSVPYSGYGCVKAGEPKLDCGHALAIALGARNRGRAGKRYLADHLLELEVERRAAARHALGHERLQVPGQDARVEQTVAYEVHELGELFVGELDRRLEQRVEAR